MPDMDGVETARELRRIREDICLLISSGYNEQELIVRFADKGQTGFLKKPYQIADVLKVLLTTLRNK